MMSASDSIKLIRKELESLNYRTQVFDSPSRGTVVAFSYTIETGTNKDTKVRVGVSFDKQGYPDYPPHWIHITPPINDQRGGAIEKYKHDGCEWLAMSRPPGNTWDQMPTKHMKYYIEEHLRKIWRDV